MSRPKIAICWLGGCGGCDEAVIDLAHNLLDVTGLVDIVLWPLALDFKYESVEKMPDTSLDLAIINGNIRNSDNAETARMLRRKSRLVLAMGSCACLGGTPGLANLHLQSDFMDWAYQNSPTVYNPKGIRPQTQSVVNGHLLTLPAITPKVRTLNDVIDVDYFLPGCCPPPDLILNAIYNVLEGKLPPRGSTLTPHKSLCDSCPRNESKPSRIKIKQFKRIHQVEAKDDLCFLAQNILCMGPATRTGCGHSCIDINLPCRGCFGATEEPSNAAARYISAIAGMLEGTTDDEIEKAMNSLGDLVGYLYRFSLPMCPLDKKES